MIENLPEALGMPLPLERLLRPLIDERAINVKRRKDNNDFTHAWIRITGLQRNPWFARITVPSPNTLWQADS